MFYQICLIMTCSTIAYQDLKDRRVLWLLFPLLGILLGVLHLSNSNWPQFSVQVLLNLALISVVLGTLYLYTKLLAKAKFLNHSFGLGDLLFFYAFAMGFPTVTFLVLFSMSVFFSTLIHFLFLRRYGEPTAPLAGLMAVFLIGITLLSFFSFTPGLYEI